MLTWFRLLEADLGIGLSDDTSLELVKVLDETPLFEGVTLQDREVLA